MLPQEQEVEMEKKVSARLVVSGRVQGVYFRMETQRTAQRFGLFGWVRNKPDGTVEALFQGDKADVESAIAWCRTGPPGAHVSQVDVDWAAHSGEFETFQVRY